MAMVDNTLRQVLRVNRLTSRTKLARAAGVSHPLLSQILSGRRRASRRVTEAVADAFRRWARLYARDEARLRRALKRHAWTA